MDAIDRFWTKVRYRTQHECWEWIGAKSSGYGRFYFKGRVIPAHRFAFELFNPPVPPSFELDHLCRNPGCVNPTHLEAVTGRVNNLRSMSAAAKYAHQTHCKHGHLLTTANVYLWQGARYCRRCRANISQRHRDRLPTQPTTRTVTCSNCGVEFTYPRNHGRRTSCSPECKRALAVKATQRWKVRH